MKKTIIALAALGYLAGMGFVTAADAADKKTKSSKVEKKVSKAKVKSKAKAKK